MGGGEAVGVYTRECLQRGELITWGEGSCFSPGVDTVSLRDRFQAHSPALPAPGVRTERKAALFF